MSDLLFSKKDISKIQTKEQLQNFLRNKNLDHAKLAERIVYNIELEQLQLELLKLQNWVRKEKKRVVVILEGRDAAGKGGAIRRFMRYMNPRSARVVALSKPSPKEKGQWYFRRHVKELPNEGEIVLFDRSWYNRAVVEPVMDFCTTEEYHQFLRHVPEFEHMLYEDGVHIVKLWFAISKEEQARRFKSRRKDPLKQWKLSPVDQQAQDLWKRYTHFIGEMFSKTHTDYCPWIIVRTDKKREARLECIRYVLSTLEYRKKIDLNTLLFPDPNVVFRFHREMILNV